MAVSLVQIPTLKIVFDPTTLLCGAGKHKQKQNSNKKQVVELENETLSRLRA